VKRIRLRPGLATLVILMVAGVAWFYFAPTDLGGSTRYVVTRGASMEPRFHTGDLAIVRPASNYRVGEIVAYWSTMLHAAVLHRIVAKDGNSYEFKGDNNHFIDPDRPTRSELLGRLWLHVPRAGRLLGMLHTQVGAALLCVVVGLLTLFGVKESRRRRRRRREGARSGRLGIPIVNSTEDHRHINPGALLAASAVVAMAFLALAVFAFARPTSRSVPITTGYVQKVQFTYSAHVRPGLVFPDGTVNTGDPIFLSMVRSVSLHIDYSLTSNAPASVSGAEKVVLAVSGPGGWHRAFTLVPRTHFAGGHAATDVTLDLPQLERLQSQIAKLIGYPGFWTFSLAVAPEVQIAGTVAGRPISTTFEPALSLQFGSGQLQLAVAQPGAGASSGGSSSASQSTYAQTQAGAVSSLSTMPNSLTALGVSAHIELLRWIAVVGLVLSVAAAICFYLRKRSEPFEETFRIQSQYGHMIVPIVGGEDLGWPPVDVPSIKSLVRLAEAGQRLILHNRSDNVDTYMLNEEGTVYRYQVKPSKVVWGEWSAPAPPLEEAA
jgi:signal peptidase I